MRVRFKYRILLLVITAFPFTELNSQCDTHIYEDLAKRVYAQNLKKSDFSSDTIKFLTIDTLDASDFNAPSIYKEYTDSDSLKQDFYTVFNSKKWEGGYFNYYELIKSPFYKSELHQSFLINDKSSTYKIDIWNAAKDITKIEGLTVVKLPNKINRTPY